MGKITLSNIAEDLAAKSSLTREAADNFMHAFVATIEKGLKEDGIVKVKGLGTFKLQEVSDRDSVNVNTGERITIKGYRKVTFTPDSTMKELVNRPFAHFEPTELNDGYPADEEMMASDSTIDENDAMEMAEEIVEDIAEEPTVEEPVAEEPVAEKPVAEEPVVEESVAEEPVVEEPVVEEPVAPVAEDASVPVSEESASVNMAEESVELVVEEAAIKPKRHRGRAVAVVILLAMVIVGLYYWHVSHLAVEEETSYAKVEEINDIKVNSNLEEELSAAWGDEPKEEKTLPTGENQQTDVVAQQESVVGDTPKSQTIDTPKPDEVSEPAEPAVKTSTEPAVKTPAEPAAKASVKPVMATTTCVVTLTESLQAKAVKDIVLADTTDYAIAGTFTTHKLKNGETIIQLSNKYYGDKRLWPYIVKHNKMKNYNCVAIGQLIDIPVLKVK